MDFQTSILEIMTTDLTTVGPMVHVNSFKHHFKRRGFHHIPVINSNGELEGIISTEDVQRSSRFFVSEESLLAKHIMTPSPMTIREDTSIVDAIKFFIDQKVRALPVLNKEGDFVGLVTPYDLMKEMLQAWEIEKELEDIEDIV